MGQQNCTLPQIIQRQCRKSDHEPCDSNWPTSEVTKVGIERFGTCERQHDRTQCNERQPAIVEQKSERMDWI